jgi:uncharacterized membrane protein (UPF0127 family)
MASGNPRVAPRSGKRHRRPPVHRVLGLLVALACTALGASVDAASHDPECPRWRAAFLGMPVRTVTIETGSGLRVQVSVRVAASEEARRAGFQCATPEEIERTAILFDFGAEVLRGFHMWNVPVPLDIAFIKASGRIVSILPMKPGARETHGPMAWFRYALETHEGFFKSHGIAVGHSVDIREGP